MLPMQIQARSASKGREIRKFARLRVGLVLVLKYALVPEFVCFCEAPATRRVAARGKQKLATLKFECHRLLEQLSGLCSDVSSRNIGKTRVTTAIVPCNLH